jgi:hypothetical protein
MDACSLPVEYRSYGFKIIYRYLPDRSEEIYEIPSVNIVDVLVEIRNVISGTNFLGSLNVK